MTITNSWDNAMSHYKVLSLLHAHSVKKNLVCNFGIYLPNSQLTAMTMDKRRITKALNSEANDSWSKHIKHLVGFYTAQKRKFFIWYFFSKCEQIRRQEAPDLIKFTEEIFNGKLIVCSVRANSRFMASSFTTFGGKLKNPKITNA